MDMDMGPLDKIVAAATMRWALVGMIRESPGSELRWIRADDTLHVVLIGVFRLPSSAAEEVAPANFRLLDDLSRHADAGGQDRHPLDIQNDVVDNLINDLPV